MQKGGHLIRKSVLTKGGWYTKLWIKVKGPYTGENIGDVTGIVVLEKG